MSDRTYGRIANALLLLGVGSALLFDSGIVSHVVAGTVGILAGALAFVLYFCNKYVAGAQHNGELTAAVASRAEKPAAPASTEAQDALSAAQAVLFAVDMHLRTGVREKSATWSGYYNAELLQTVRAAFGPEAIRRQAAHMWLSHYATHHARTLRWSVPKDTSMALMRPEVELSPTEVAACAVEIVSNLAVADKAKEWEYTFGPQGLRISLRGAQYRYPSSQERHLDPEALFADIS